MSESDRLRVGGFVRELVRRELLRRGIRWASEITWNEEVIYIHLLRGDLLITEAITFGGHDPEHWHEDASPH